MPRVRRPSFAVIIGVVLAAVLAALIASPLTSGWSRASADSYLVQEGDTLWGIANRLQVRISILLALNEQIESANDIYVGQRIQVPDNAVLESDEDGADETEAVTQSADAPTIIYRIAAGDTLSEIAASRGIDVAAILALNPSLNPNLLWVDAEILLPSHAALDEGDPQPSLYAGIQSTEDEASDDSPPSSSRSVEYIVSTGDSLSAIAESAGITLEMLRGRNPQFDTRVIHPGDVVYIPIPDYRAPAVDPSEVTDGLTERYTVRAGDSASQIAQRYDLTLEELRRLNGGIDLSVIFVGQALNVPWSGGSVDVPAGTAPAVEVRRRTHRVAAGETFEWIAALYGLSLAELRAQNPLRPSDLLVIGELLYLPGTIEPPNVAEERTLWEADLTSYAAAALGVTPHTLIANHSWLEPGQWLGAGTTWRVPLREGLIVTVQPGDTLQSIANRHGVDMDLILADPANGVEHANEIVIGQEIILPLAMPDFAWPSGGEITDPFGLCRSWDCSYRHKGLDLALDFYEPIVASADGVVTFAGGDAALGLGWYVEIEHEYGWRTTYAHLIEFAVYPGQFVSQGDVIGYNGSTGHSTGPHLHFEVRHNDWYVDPLVVLP